MTLLFLLAVGNVLALGATFVALRVLVRLMSVGITES